jgi:hypothetical protein
MANIQNNFYLIGGVPEWTIGTVLKTVEPNKLREFESHPLRLDKNYKNLAKLTHSV